MPHEQSTEVVRVTFELDKTSGIPLKRMATAIYRLNRIIRDQPWNTDAIVARKLLRRVLLDSKLVRVPK